MLTCPAVGGDYSLNGKYHNKLSSQCQQEETVFRQKNQKVHDLYKFSELFQHIYHRLSRHCEGRRPVAMTEASEFLR